MPPIELVPGAGPYLSFLNARKLRSYGHRIAGFVRSRGDCSAHL
jgi:hypothetical protein